MAEDLCPHFDKDINYLISSTTSIYKDECTRCFCKTFDENGIDLCLKCFNGSCTIKSKGHSLLHFQQSSHPIVLNIKQKAIKEKPDASKKITKLGIGVEGGIDFVNEKIETNWTIQCIPCNKFLKIEKKEHFAHIETILNSHSASDKDQIGRWEAQRKPCNHTKDLKQIADIKKYDQHSKPKCNACELMGALWLCLTCGNIGCSRKNYDGTGGNNHGLNHNSSTLHPCVVKLGTITPNGEGSVYCYACDKDVIDEKLGLHLEPIGIDITKEKKTEKTTAELELSANLALSLSKFFEEGQQLNMLFGPGFTGIKNLGATCYVNSVVQVLFTIPEFAELYSEKNIIHFNQCKQLPAKCLKCQLIKLGIGLLSGEYSQPKLLEVFEYEGITEEEKNKKEYYQEGIAPHMFRNLVAQNHPEFSSNRHQDASEYLWYLIDKIDKIEIPINQKSPSEVFQFTMETKIKCNVCGFFKINTSKQSQLTLDIPINMAKEDSDKLIIPLAKLLDYYARDEIVDYRCSKCKKITLCIKTLRFVTFPKYLFLVVQRFFLDGFLPKKLKFQLEMPKDSKIILEPLRFINDLPDKMMEDDNEIEVPTDPKLLNELLTNGLPELAAKHALIQTGNISSEIAIDWYFTNMENPMIKQPVPTIKKKKGPDIVEVNNEKLKQLTDLGFEEKKARIGLSKTNNDIERAVDYMINNADEIENDLNSQNQGQPKFQTIDLNSKYKGEYYLHALITHLGSDAGMGHYVSHIMINNKWIYFNDLKVAEAKSAPLEKSFLYFLKRID